MSKKMKNNTPKKKKRSTLARWFRQTVLRKHDIDYDNPEVIETPLKIVAQNFFAEENGRIRRCGVLADTARCFDRTVFLQTESR